MPNSSTSIKELELERERLINENLDLKLHIQYLEDLLADHPSLKETSFLEYLNPPKDASSNKLAILHQKLEDARAQLEEARTEAATFRIELEVTKQERDKIRCEKCLSGTSCGFTPVPISKSDAASNTDSDQDVYLFRESEEEKLLRAELEISRDFAKAEVSSVNGFHLALEAESRISELEKSLEETKAASQYHKNRLSLHQLV